MFHRLACALLDILTGFAVLITMVITATCLGAFMAGLPEWARAMGFGVVCLVSLVGVIALGRICREGYGPSVRKRYEAWILYWNPYDNEDPK